MLLWISKIMTVFPFYISTRNHTLYCSHIALCSYPHVKVSIRDLSQIFTTPPIFQQSHYFRQNIWVDFLVQFHFQYIFQDNLTNCNMSLKCQTSSSESNGKFGDELNGALKTQGQAPNIFRKYFQMKMVVKIFGKYLHQERLPR